MVDVNREYLSVDTEREGPPHLSHSRVSRYLLCPEQYRLYYVEGLRPTVPSSNLEFGKAIHQALAECFTNGVDPETRFTELWEELREAKLRYPFRSSWETLNERGQELMRKFVAVELERFSDVEACEAPFELNVSNLDVPLIGIIDLVARVDGNRKVVDFKTAGQKYQDFEVSLSDQLTTYRLARPNVAECSFCVLVKTNEPRIDWYHGKRTGSDLVELLRKTEHVGHAISSNVFYRRPGKWCSYCDFLPICLSRGGSGCDER